MKHTLIFTSSVIVAALSLAALPANAQARRNGGQQGGGGRVSARQSAPRESSRGASPQTRQSAPRGSYSAPRTMSRPSGNRPYSGAQALPRTYGSGSYGARTVAPRYYAPSYGGGGGYGYASPGYRGYGGRPGMIRPYFSRFYVRPYGWAPYYPYRFARPYYAFSPWLSLGFGIWAGYPVPYPWVYLGSYQPTVFGVYAGGGYQALPGSSNYVVAGTDGSADNYGGANNYVGANANANAGANNYVGANANANAGANNYVGANANAGANNYGGASFDIQPADANLFVDGQFVGVVGNFGPTSEPLTMGPGQHRIAVQKEGFRPMEWDVTVDIGQVVPYRGVLEKQ